MLGPQVSLARDLERLFALQQASLTVAGRRAVWSETSAAAGVARAGGRLTRRL